MNLALFEDAGVRRLLPLTWLRAPFELVCGRDTLLDKMRTHVGQGVCRLFLRDLMRPVVEARVRPGVPEPSQECCLLNARALVTGPLRMPPPGVAWTLNGELIATVLSGPELLSLPDDLFHDEARLAEWLAGLVIEAPPAEIRLIQYPWELVHANARELLRLGAGPSAHEGFVHPGAHLLHPEQIHIAAGAVIKPGVVLDAEKGPIWIERDAQIQPNAVIEGPCSIGRGTIIRPGAAIREGVTIGPYCKVGGEVEGSVLVGYSNKQHDGFLGHSYLGQWVNLGASTVTSDLKNTYGSIRVGINGVGVESGQMFIGSIIGDHAKTGIGTILPTGCVIGAAANVFTQRGVPRFVPSFAWLTDAGMTHYEVEKALRIARIVMGRRNVTMSEAEAQLFARVAAEALNVESAGWQEK